MHASPYGSVILGLYAVPSETRNTARKEMKEMKETKIH